MTITVVVTAITIMLCFSVLATLVAAAVLFSIRRRRSIEDFHARRDARRGALLMEPFARPVPSRRNTTLVEPTTPLPRPTSKEHR